MSDLRTFLEQIRQTRRTDILEIDRQVSPNHETATIVAKLEDKGRSPIVLFRQVKGTHFPVVSNVCGSTGRLAAALGCSLKDLSERWAKACADPIAPIEVVSAPVQEVVHRGDWVDLTLLPALVYHANDAPNPYLTGGIVAAKDPLTQKVNLSYHRLMVRDRRSTGICIEPGKHLDRIRQRYEDLGQDMPIAVFFGHHPAWSLGTLYSGDPEVEEWDIIGGLLGAPLALVPCLSQPLMVPARAELVLEGRVLAGVRAPEGPFGEFTGYGTGITQSPVFEVTALTHRQDALFQDIVSGQTEHLILPMLAIEYRVKKEALEASPNVTQVSLAAPLTVFVALDKKDDAEPGKIINHLLHGDIYTKNVIVVDADVDIKDFRQVLGALSLNTQADQAIKIFANLQGTPLDPSCPNPDGRSAKLGIDATRSLTQRRAVTRNAFPPALWDQIDVSALLKR